MAKRYYKPEAISPTANLKPMHLTSAISLNSRLSDGSYDALRPDTFDDWNLRSLEARDAQLKARIRLLRVVARALATICSIATLVPLIMTIVKFLQTKDIYYVVNDVERTAWASGSITWYTYMYAAVSAVSFLLNFAVLISYLRGTKSANKADQISTIWSWATIITHIVTWAVAVSVYRYGKEPVDGRFKDLWGWTCSTTAAELQEVLISVDFAKYCTVQTSSYYAGIANTALAILTDVIMVFVLLRSKSKKKVRKATSGLESDMEPLRG